MSGELVVTGGPEVVKGFQEIERAIQDLSEVSRQTLGPLIPEVRARSPVRTGLLASSWSLVVDKESGSIESGLRYAGPMEFGVPEREIAPARMVRSTLESNEQRILAGYSEAIATSAARAGFRVER